MTYRLLQCSDFHLDARPDDDPRRMKAVRRHVDRLKPDLLVFTGDLVESGTSDPSSLERGLAVLRSFDTPFHALPGNHDVGNKLSVGKHTVTQEAVAQWRDVIGGDRFVRDVGSWRIVGFNSQITGTGWREEDDQRDWLAEAVACARPVVVFTHMPLFLYDRDEDLVGREGYWQVDREPRRELLSLLERDNVKLIGSGHVHWHARFDDQPTRLWCPSCYSIVREPHYPPAGDCTGMILYTLGEGLSHQLITDNALARCDGDPQHE